ncbi:MAG: hypothetical protein RLZZ507_2301 [Cyanobacteriota bacterium]|jgi:hypothetical protein
MTSENTDIKQRSTAKVIYRFLGGTAFGVLVVTIPISLSSIDDLNLFHLVIALFLILLSGLLSSIWGEKFIDAITRVLNSFGS